MPQAIQPSGGDEAAEQAVAVVEVPECPTLAPSVQLVGEMQDMGFNDRQWLVQRGGRFIQLTELLYHILEQANGDRTLEEIAARVTESTDWLVSADNVRQLVLTKLVPLGLITPADGAGEPHRREQARSPLALNMRTRMLAPSIIDPISRVLQHLYAPPVFILVLALAAFAHGWVYLVHGVNGSLRDTLNTPGGLLIVLTILLAASVFHEFGHASALRYGGGRARGMGMGLYLVYPAFYTDTTDSYRLGRWARVRTDLGGFYFHLAFALGLIGLYLLLGQEFLLLPVLLINLDIVRQCMPFVRFDGYWVLADLTGIPDFFSQMAAFLRSVSPIPGWKGEKLPNLKPWVKAVFAGYILVTIPGLAFLVVLLIVRLPRILETIWDSFFVQAAAFSDALGNASPLIATASSLQMLILALQLLAIAYLLGGLGLRLFRTFWNWSRKAAALFA